ncbi:MAG: hypothetical protein AB2813_12375 [Candidatus Sedimenticola endophacoides]
MGTRDAFKQLKDHLRQNIAGQEALAEGLEADFHRIQFTPDAARDLTESDIYRPENQGTTL